MFHISMAGPHRPHLHAPWRAVAARQDDPSGVDARDRITVALICGGLLSAFVIDMAILYFSMFRP
ncbi:conserved hypothetical protein [Gluconacetobacter diazotrophicus PA1 5]|uniref:Uncharacterized protein n=2 Tax=Gluconacetobacter diazotrophicus TaxID=33996 RepID=A0A7W4I383_GLUDI|nr:hypothetical protein [Gluconacetobacter diazotrophicus]ACI50325.1 conserved hypothetical protein [Gluconacetobacter diazotrophicus PA1 5]MBB2154729.1 hypothetical protein [Gluconacetobacter diazotrophicus]TWB08352.1 hypothetical protein FBZ86_10791 [Gluconacetobacter diazotrophicus]CAP56257.1 putative membrane protein [Gluconacetobacter diazotrophicus PA1 5]